MFSPARDSIPIFLSFFSSPILHLRFSCPFWYPDRFVFFHLMCSSSWNGIEYFDKFFYFPVERVLFFLVFSASYTGISTISLPNQPFFFDFLYLPYLSSEIVLYHLFPPHCQNSNLQPISLLKSPKSQTEKPSARSSPFPSKLFATRP